MLFVRSLLYNILFPVWTALVTLGCLPLLLGNQRVVAWAGYIWAQGVIVLLRVCCGIKCVVRGREYLPPYPFIIASKHQSVIETIIFHQIVDAPVYVLKKELLRVPLFGAYLKLMGMIPIDRSGKAAALKKLIQASNQAIAAKRPVIIFPEGTRTAPGQHIPYQPGIAAIYSQSNAPVVPTALNTGLLWGKGSFIKKPGTVTIEFLPPLYPGLKRDVFMRTLEEQIETATDRLCNR